MSHTNDPGDVAEVLPSGDAAPHIKRHCPVCGGEDFIKFSAAPVKDLVGEDGVAPLAHLRAYRERKASANSLWRTPEVYFGYSFIDTKTGKEIEGDVANPFLRLCLSCGFMAWHLNRADRDRIREQRDRLMNDLD